jgi:hypothetical protein
MYVMEDPGNTKYQKYQKLEKNKISLLNRRVGHFQKYILFVLFCLQFMPLKLVVAFESRREMWG